jgi:hypothetical protein
MERKIALSSYLSCCARSCGSRESNWSSKSTLCIKNPKPINVIIDNILVWEFHPKLHVITLPQRNRILHVRAGYFEEWVAQILAL